MSGKESKRAASHAQRASEIDLNTVRVQLSPDVLTSLARLEKTVHHSQHFSGELLTNLRGLISGKPIPVDYALSEMALIAKEAMKHIQQTGDHKADQALDYFLVDLMGAGQDPKPITLVRGPGKVR